jgi:glyoxylate/hydroxypyruvate reductase
MKSTPIVSLCCPTIDPQPWARALQASLPSAQVLTWPHDAAQADYALTWSPTQAFFDAQPRLKAVFALGAGVDSLLRLKLPQELNLVRIEDGGMGQQMADYVTHALLRHFRHFDRYDEEMQQGAWQQHSFVDFSQITVGVMGLGQLGSHMAQRALSLGFRVLGYSTRLKDIPGISCYSQADFSAFLKPCHALICALPLTEHTQNILNKDHLSQLQTGALLINVARGAHLVESDLLALLASGQISSAYLDVLREEPAPADHPFRNHPRISLTPHIAALTLLEPSIVQISQKISALEAGEAITGIVQRERGY